MNVKIKDLNNIEIEASKDDSMNTLWACDFDFMIHFYFEQCRDAFIKGCVEYLEDVNTSNENKSKIIDALLKNNLELSI